MRSGRIVFAQLMDTLPRYEFKKCVRRYQGDHHVRSLSCYEQFLVLAYAHLMGKESLRDIETCLRAVEDKLYHCGVRSDAARSTLADANESRDWRIFADFAGVLIAQAADLYAQEEFSVQLRQAAYALDSTTISLCLSLFPIIGSCARENFQPLEMALRGTIPTVVIVTPAAVADVTVLDELAIEAGAFYVMDRGYPDFVRFDQTVVLADFKTKRHYPAILRRIGCRDAQTGKRFVFLTNNFSQPAPAMAQLYKSRWQIELFFKWIKQHLRIKAFYGTSENAVKIQVWVAISVYVLAALLKKKLALPQSLYTILQILSATLFENQPISRAFARCSDETENPGTQNQLCFQGFLTGQ